MPPEEETNEDSFVGTGRMGGSCVIEFSSGTWELLTNIPMYYDTRHRSRKESRERETHTQSEYSHADNT